MADDNDGGSRARAVLRLMAWERAKGELHSILQTYWDEDYDEGFEDMRKAVNAFIKKVEDDGLVA
jgi:hypothetical protein